MMPLAPVGTVNETEPLVVSTVVLPMGMSASGCSRVLRVTMLVPRWCVELIDDCSVSVQIDSGRLISKPDSFSVFSQWKALTCTC
jgi:hypothetical protein